jgi:hypothetical protein
MNFKIGGIAAIFGFVLSLIIGLVFRNGAFAFVRALTFAVFFFILANIFLIIIRRYIPDLLEFESESGGDSRPGSRINITEGDTAASMLGGEAGLESLDAPQSRGGEDSDLTAEPDLSNDRFSVDGDYDGGSDGFESGALIGEEPSPDIHGGLSNLDGNLAPNIPSLGPALDQIGEDSYNEKGSIAERGEVSPPAKPTPVSREDAALPDSKGSSVDVLPDFEAMSQAFLASTQKAEKSENEDATTGQTEDVFQLSFSGQSPDPATKYYTGNKPVELEGDFPPKQIAQAIQTVLKRDEQ